MNFGHSLEYFVFITFSYVHKTETTNSSHTRRIRSSPRRFISEYRYTTIITKTRNMKHSHFFVFYNTLTYPNTIFDYFTYKYHIWYDNFSGKKFVYFEDFFVRAGCIDLYTYADFFSKDQYLYIYVYLVFVR